MVSLHVEYSRAKSMPHYNDIHKMELLRLPVLKTLYRDERQNSSCKFSPIPELLYKAIVHPEYSNREARTQSQHLIYVISSEKLVA